MNKLNLHNPIRETFRLSARGERAPAKARRTAQPVSVTRVHPEVWATALKLADGDALRLEVVSSEEVAVHNSQDWR